jgi:molybdopterin-guanine dinucleotide biosynthesis protein A
MTLTTVLFAGGLSRRMGADKATLAFAGEPLWARQLRTLRQLDPSAIWVSARARPKWCPPGLDAVCDEPPSRGPLSGLTAVLRRLHTSHLLALAIDLPLMTSEQLLKLWSQATPRCGVVPRHAQTFEPLAAIYPAEAAVIAETVLASREASLQHFSQVLLRENRILPFPLTEAEQPLFQNVNTREDLCKTRALYTAQKSNES